MIRLHYYPSTAAMVPHIVLEELGARYERVFVDRAVGGPRPPE
jgi:glutathione S-transferase